MLSPRRRQRPPYRRLGRPLRLWRPLRRGLLAVFIAGLLLLAAGGDYRPTAVDLAAAPYRYSILAWELTSCPAAGCGGWLTAGRAGQL